MAETRIVTNYKGGAVIASPEQAAIVRRGKVERRRKRIEAAQATAREALRRMVRTMPAERVAAYAALQGREYLQAWALVVEEQFKLAMSDGRGSTAAARFVGEVAGLLTRADGKLEEIPPPTGVQINIDTEAAREILKMFRAEKAANPALAERAKTLLEAGQ